MGLLTAAGLRDAIGVEIGLMDINGLEALVAEAYRTGSPDRASVIRTEAGALGEATTARENAVLGGAWLVAYKLGADPSDLDRAIGHLQRAYVEAPSASRAVNLASSLLELNDLPNSGPTRRDWFGTKQRFPCCATR